MSGNTIGSLVGGAVGGQIGFVVGGIIGGLLFPTKTEGPRLSDATRQTVQEGVPIPWGYGTFPTSGHLIWQADVVEHEVREDGKGGPQHKDFEYTISYAIGVCAGPITGLQKIKRNGKLVYDISPTSDIPAESAKFLQKCSIYLGDETQNVDPIIEAFEGVGETGPMRGLAYIVVEDDETSAGEIPQYEFVVQMCGTLTESDYSIDALADAFHYPLQGDYDDATGNFQTLVPAGNYSFEDVGFKFSLPVPGGNCQVTQSSGVPGTSYTISLIGRIDQLDTATANLAGHYTNFFTGFHHWAFFTRDMQIGCSINALSGTGDEILAPTAVALGQEFVVTMRRTPTLLEMFFDGALVDSIPTSGFFAASGALIVGGGEMTGSVGQLWGVNRALTDEEILQSTAHMGIVPAGWHAVPDAPGWYVDDAGDLHETG